MKLINGLVDDKKRAELRAAMRRGDFGALVRKDGGTAPKGPPLPQPTQRESIRGSNLSVFFTKNNGVPVEEILRLTDEKNLVIASNKQIDQALQGSEDWKLMQKIVPCWTGTMTAYEEPGKPFGRIIEYIDKETGLSYIFPVPDEYVGVKDAILVAEHPDFILETDGNNRIVRAATVDLVEKFPAASDGCYLTDAKHGIPFGEEIDITNFEARILWRIDKRVGLVARFKQYNDYGTRHIGLTSKASNGHGVAVESDGTDVSK